MPSRFLRLSDHNLFLLTHFLPNREDTVQYDPLASRFPLTIGPSPVLLTHFLPNREHTLHCMIHAELFPLPQLVLHR